MPMLMSLEGPQLSAVERFRVQPPKSWVKAHARLLNGLGATVPPPVPPMPPVTFFGALMAHPVVLVLGVFGGFWLAGSKTGRGLFQKKK